MSGHTPGPWYVDDFRDVCAGNFALANTRIGVRGDDEEFANARLIAAAPCMLTAIARYLAARKALDAAPTHNGPAFDAAMDEHDAALAELSRVATLARGETA